MQAGHGEGRFNARPTVELIIFQDFFILDSSVRKYTDQVLFFDNLFFSYNFFYFYVFCLYLVKTLINKRKDTCINDETFKLLNSVVNLFLSDRTCVSTGHPRRLLSNRARGINKTLFTHNEPNLHRACITLKHPLSLRTKICYNIRIDPF